MSETFWEPGSGGQPPYESQPEPEHHEQGAEPAAVTLSVDDFAALEERIVRAVDMVKRERQAKAAAEERVSQLEAQLQEQTPKFDHLEKELNGLRAERDHVRQRVERLLKQFDALEL
jgi:hypothetical protein